MAFYENRVKPFESRPDDFCGRYSFLVLGLETADSSRGEAE
jgi:hypothetical protein